MFKRRMNADVRIYAAWGAGVIAIGLIISLIMIPPIIGMADSGDYGRVFVGTGLVPLHPNDSRDVLYFQYAHERFGYGHFNFGGYVSTHVLLVAIAGGIGRLFDAGSFDIRILGACYAALFAWATVLFVRNAPRTGGRKGTLFVALTLTAGILFVFGDIGYLAYFQSFFGEPYALTGMLLLFASALAVASGERPSGKLIWLFVATALAVATSKIQNAPLGIAFALLAWRMSGLRADKEWKRHTRIGAALLVLVSALMVVAAPDRLRNTNLYQSIFYGVLKDSPHVSQDMKELGIPERYAALAGTNYFQGDTAIPQKDPVLRAEVLEKRSHKDIALYYLRHPSRFMQKLDRAAENAMFIRPHYLGNYDPSAGKPPGALSYAYSGWSRWKETHMPTSSATYFALFAAYFAALAVVWGTTASRRIRFGAETLAIVALAGIFSCVIPLIGDGEADLGKHMFMFNVCFDMMVVSMVTAAAYGLARLVERGSVSARRNFHND
ncbi:ArnT family glycosyltransferase [Cohnella suwonensis]|uniref:ArnT family glycosyltransferase n=1 Tax=Cohnella suwonensis TaxID=696072 RepID=A0ABW0LYG1_9BACL